MKDNSLDGHRGKVALSDTTRSTPAATTSSSSGVKCELKSPQSADGSAATNFDDDYNEWELGIGDLIIDLDADIEKTNERNSSNSTTTSNSTPNSGSVVPPQTHHHHSHHHHGHHHHHSSSSGGHHQNGTVPSPAAASSSSSESPNASSAATTFGFLGSSSSSQDTGSNSLVAMSNSKSPRLSGSGASSSGVGGTGGPSGGATAPSNGGGSNGAPAGSGAFEHQATVDKGLKMKIKRKTVGSKYSEAKHEIVQSDTKSSPHALSESAGASNGSAGAGAQAPGMQDTPKSKHSSSKGRNSSHREKKEKNRDKDKSASTKGSGAPAEMNGMLGVMSPLKITNNGVSLSSPAPPSLCSNSSPLPQSGSGGGSAPVASPGVSRSASAPGSSTANSPSSNSLQEAQGGASNSVAAAPAPASSSPPMPNLTLKLENKFSTSPLPQSCPLPTVVIKQEEMPSSPPSKKMKLENCEKNGELDCPSSPGIPEMKDTSTCTSVGTITEPDCLGPCEPGTSVMLEGIVWQETEGGVLVVNVTWRGKTYVGTLLDCTKHDWAPPRFCESPTSDVDSKTSKGRGKRGRGGNNSSSDVNTFTDTRNCVQSKLRNGKGRRTTINSNASTSGFTVPNSPAKSENGVSNSKRKGRPADLEINSNNNNQTEGKSSKRSRSQARATPTSSASAEFPQPSSPVLIVCPEPNCSKKYKHINGLRYHQTHAHSASDSSSKMDDTTTEDSKDVTNSSDNEESMQESASVSHSPAPSFANSVSPHTSGGKPLLNENASSSSSNLNGLPDSDPYTLTPDLSTLASVAINDSKTGQKAASGTARPMALVSQDGPAVNAADADNVVPASSSSSVLPATSSAISSPVLTSAIPSPGLNLSSASPAATTSVIQSSSSVDNIPAISPAVTVSIPTSHVIFNQGTSGVSSSTPTYTTSTVVCNNTSPLSPSRCTLSSVTFTTTFAPVSSTVANATATSPSPMLPMMDKNKIKQERPDKYKPKSPLSTPTIRPIVPAPSPQLLALSANMPPTHPGMGITNHGMVASSLKPIQPKPTILGEPTTVNPALESLKKEKSKHKKKSKDRDKEREKKLPSLPLTPTKLGMSSNDECEAMELTPYPNLEAVAGSSAPPHAELSPLVPQAKPPESGMDMSLPDDSMNENIQSPAYSDISDANDTAPVLESEVPSVKEKEDKIGKSTPDASQSPAANIGAYGMYPYYSQPPYLLPSVSPQSSVSGTQAQGIGEKSELNKKVEQDRAKENRPWSNPSGESRERQHIEHHESEKKPSRDDGSQSNSVSPAAAAGSVQDYAMQQHYPYSYGYVQGYPYSIEPAYHMHLLESDPHYKQQYKQYIEEQQRLYKEQQHHQQQQHLQQQLQQQHHHQQQQQQQQQSHHSHSQQHHHSQHQSSSSSSSHHQNKSQHHSSAIKDERDRAREKERTSSMDKMSSSGLIIEHSSKIQHSSMSLMSNKDHDIREMDTRPPSLPAQARIDSSTPSSAAAALKEKQNENHQIMKENIELKSQMEESKNKINQYEMAMLYERHRDDMRRYYMYQERVIEQQQQKLEPGIHHHTHHHQTIQTHGHLQASSSSFSTSLKPHKEELSGALSGHSKSSSHYGEAGRSSSVASPAKSDHMKPPHPNSTSSPKGSSGARDSSLSGTPKEYSGSRDGGSSKKDGKSSSDQRQERSETERRDDGKLKPDKIKVEAKQEPEGQKPTMETTGPPPPPTNSYAYLHPSYLQPPPPHFPHMPFEPAAHAMYRGGINPMIVSTPHYGSSPYVHPQIRYVTPGACELPAHSQPPTDALGGKLHSSGPPKALDLLHQVSQHYTTTHKIHELQEHALMSPTPTSTPSSSSTPSTSTSGGAPGAKMAASASSSSSSEPAVAVAKMEVGASRETSRSPPTQRHLHTHHHTHVGVGYPIYDPYGVTAQKSYT